MFIVRNGVDEYMRPLSLSLSLSHVRDASRSTATRTSRDHLRRRRAYHTRRWTTILAKNRRLKSI